MNTTLESKPFSTNSRAVGCVFYIDAGEDGAIGGLKAAGDGKIGILAVGETQSFPRTAYQVIR